MGNIYKHSNEFDIREIHDKISQIENEIDVEQTKPLCQKNREKIFNLIYARFVQGLKLSTRNNFL